MKPRIFIAVLAMLVAVARSRAESGYVNVRVEDVQGHPVRNLQIGIENGASVLTKEGGLGQIALVANAAPNDWITLQLLHSPPGKDFAIVSPWDYRAQIPSFANKPENFLRIVVVQRGDRAALESGTVLVSLVAKINKANAPRAVNPQAPPSDPKETLLAVAKQYGLSADDIDTAIRAWGAKTTDPYEAGLAALYERNYMKATAALEDSLKQRKQKLEADQKAAQAIPQDRKSVADAAFFLGQSRYEQGKYSESALAFQECLLYRPNDPIVLNNLALSLDESGDYAAAEPLFRRALAIDEKALGPDHPEVATVLNNLAELLHDRDDYDAAEPLYRRALAINERTLGPDNPTTAKAINNLALLLQDKGDLADAEPLYRRGLAIDEKALGPDNPITASHLNNLASLLEAKGDLNAAEPLYRRALDIDEKALGPDHPEVATVLSNLASLLEAKGDLNAAEPLYRRALDIDEKALGPDHPKVGTDLNSLSLLLKKEGNLAAAEPLYHRALAIAEKTLGPDNPEVAIVLSNLASLLRAKGDLAGAETLYRRALAIDQKALGPDNPSTIAVQKHLSDLQNQTSTAPK
ncbi:tetratricopeptide repeat protein [Alloacidobacterium sp.]|uniref:tetratricopeptide repeat protein n=1 Tax=Alloacidobacterium sp. TaxID=2951999 RepID=UPI002D465822|nr:tetratricopeptide repeat protein [Alloacidobacterium sp.]HYK34833.1 tetratricopeptide repeat protein [Alloacidobacterium sp.]